VDLRFSAWIVAKYKLKTCSSADYEKAAKFVLGSGGPVVPNVPRSTPSISALQVHQTVNEMLQV
jgi:hypothetical protein